MRKISNIAIVAPNSLPIPAMKGGAIESIIENLIRENEIYKKVNFTIYSIYDNNAKKESEKYHNSIFKYIKTDTTEARIYEFFRKIIAKLTGKLINDYYIKKIFKDINRSNYDRLIIEGDKKYVSLLKKNKNKTDVYLHIHHDSLKCGNEKIINNCDKVITVSDYIKNRTLINNKVLDSKIVSLKNAVNTEVFNKEKYKNELNKIRKGLNIDNEDIVIGFTGRLIPEKGIKELLLAIKNLKIPKKIKVIIIGSATFGQKSKSDYEEEIKLLSNSMNKNIIYTGYIHNSNIPKINSIVDISVVPSIWEEPAGLVVLEALSLGIPLIVTDSGGISEYINDECAITVKRDENLINNLSNSLEKLIMDDELRIKMSIKAREQGVKFDITKYYEDFIKIIKNNKGNKNEN